MKSLRRMPRLAGGTLLLLLVEWIIFKVCYPQGGHLLRVSFQYLALELSALYLFWVIRSIFGLGGRSSVLLYLFLFVNPLFPYTANIVSGDALFAAVSVLWIIQFCLILHKRRWYYIITLALLAGLAFSLWHSSGLVKAYPILRWLSLLFIACNIFYLCALIGFLARKGYRDTGKAFTTSIALVTVLLVVHFYFSVYAGPVILGEQVFAIMLAVAFGLSLIDYRAGGWLNKYNEYDFFEQGTKKSLEDVWQKIRHYR